MKKFRDQEGLFTVEGEKMVSEALGSSFHVEKVYRADEIGQETMSRISALSSPSPVLAVVRKPSGLVLEGTGEILPALVPGKSAEKRHDGPAKSGKHQGLFLALDTIRDPGNLGTILRIADWFGIDAVFASRDTVGIALEAGGHVYGTFLDGENIYGKTLDCGADSPSVIVIGNESDGISPEVATMVSDRLFIPPYPAGDPGSESLNAAVATAITVSEFRRRQTFNG